MFEIPHYAADVYTKREDLRNLREHVLLVVRDYNRLDEDAWTFFHLLINSFVVLPTSCCLITLDDPVWFIMCNGNKMTILHVAIYFSRPASSLINMSLSSIVTMFVSQSRSIMILLLIGRGG